MISPQVEKYLESLIPKRSELLMEIEAYAHVHNIPIMELVGIEAFIHILKIHQPKRILEIGTAIGYSALRFAEALPEATIVTIERDATRLDKACEFIERSGYKSRIKVIAGDALDVVSDIEQMDAFDALFIDAAKGQYQRFFALYEPMVTNGGMIISDNVLFRGLVAEESQETRLKGIARKLSRYNEWLMQQNQYETAILPVGDGVALSIKK